MDPDSAIPASRLVVVVAGKGEELSEARDSSPNVGALP